MIIPYGKQRLEDLRGVTKEFASILTQRLAQKHKKPCIHFDLNRSPKFLAAKQLYTWACEYEISVPVAFSPCSITPHTRPPRQGGGFGLFSSDYQNLKSVLSS